ncbi:MAG: acyl-CoA thioesterase [Alphaproteobacteria bacterium]|nr:MAG: acyl-CoA thioesterase [Alphaproteobacteria bacterium]
MCRSIVGIKPCVQIFALCLCTTLNSTLESREQPELKRFSIKVAPVAHDIDHNGHVNNSVYLRWVQEVVIAHWTNVASSVLLSRINWIALKHEIEYKKEAFFGEQLEIATCITYLKGYKAVYETAVRRGECLLASAKSVWAALDTQTGKITRLSKKEIEELFPEQSGEKAPPSVI